MDRKAFLEQMKDQQNGDSPGLKLVASDGQEIPKPQNHGKGNQSQFVELMNRYADALDAEVERLLRL